MMQLALMLLVSLMFCGGETFGADEGDVRLTEAELELVSLTNNARNANGLKALKIDDRLMRQARTHCLWMAANSSLSHSCDGAENIGWGYAENQGAMAGWMESPGHRANILGDYTKIGVGIYMTSEGDRYYCQQFGSDVVPIVYSYTTTQLRRREGLLSRLKKKRGRH